MGLREQKRLRQRAEILENAIALFQTTGLEAVKVRDIASACAISDATFFNYFSSKSALLSEWSDGIVERAFAGVVAAQPEVGLRLAVRRAAAALADELAEGGDLLARSFQETAAVSALRGGAAAPGRAVTDDPLEALIGRAQARDEVRADVEPALLAQLLRSVVRTSLAHACAGGEPSTDEVADRLRRAADVLLDGFRKRNQRVRGPLPSTHSP